MGVGAFFDLYGAKIALFFSDDLMLLLVLVLMLVLLIEWVDLSDSLMCLLVAVVVVLLNAFSLCCIVSLAVICTGTARENDREGGESRGGDGVGGNIIS